MTPALKSLLRLHLLCLFASLLEHWTCICVAGPGLAVDAVASRPSNTDLVDVSQNDPGSSRDKSYDRLAVTQPSCRSGAAGSRNKAKPLSRFFRRPKKTLLPAAVCFLLSVPLGGASASGPQDPVPRINVVALGDSALSSVSESFASLSLAEQQPANFHGSDPSTETTTLLPAELDRAIENEGPGGEDEKPHSSASANRPKRRGKAPAAAFATTRTTSVRKPSTSAPTVASPSKVAASSTGDDEQANGENAPRDDAEAGSDNHHLASSNTVSQNTNGSLTSGSHEAVGDHEEVTKTAVSKSATRKTGTETETRTQTTTTRTRTSTTSTTTTDKYAEAVNDRQFSAEQAAQLKDLEKHIGELLKRLDDREGGEASWTGFSLPGANDEQDTTSGVHIGPCFPVPVIRRMLSQGLSGARLSRKVLGTLSAFAPLFAQTRDRLSEFQQLQISVADLELFLMPMLERLKAMEEGKITGLHAEDELFRLSVGYVGLFTGLTSPAFHSLGTTDVVIFYMNKNAEEQKDLVDNGTTTTTFMAVPPGLSPETVAKNEIRDAHLNNPNPNDQQLCLRVEVDPGVLINRCYASVILIGTVVSSTVWILHECRYRRLHDRLSLTTRYLFGREDLADSSNSLSSNSRLSASGALALASGSAPSASGGLFAPRMPFHDRPQDNALHHHLRSPSSTREGTGDLPVPRAPLFQQTDAEAPQSGEGSPDVVHLGRRTGGPSQFLENASAAPQRGRNAYATDGSAVYGYGAGSNYVYSAPVEATTGQQLQQPFLYSVLPQSQDAQPQLPFGPAASFGSPPGSRNAAGLGFLSPRTTPSVYTSVGPLDQEIPYSAQPERFLREEARHEAAAIFLPPQAPTTSVFDGSALASSSSSSGPTPPTTLALPPARQNSPRHGAPRLALRNRRTTGTSDAGPSVPMLDAVAEGDEVATSPIG
ncbi:unnamed protein product [Amoebophrya sp. A120]|nr:unnamed protein product [Amoebophrya sp. A120]|eukprot:GSA120T00022994001.1